VSAQVSGYQATRNTQGHLTIHEVPIFVECTRGEMCFDGKWIATAVAKAQQAAVEGYLPPLHIRHHDDGPVPEPAGFFRITRTGPITFKGKTRTAIFADLVITRPWVEEDVLAARLPYRSVEIFDVDKPAIDSLALLDHEPPYLELPMLMVADVEEPSTLTVPTSGQTVRVANATFANPYLAQATNADDHVVACFRRGQAAHLLTQDELTMTTKTTKDGNGAAFAYGEDEKMAEEKMGEEAEKKAEMADDADDADEKMQDGMSAEAVCEAIKAGAFDMEQLAMIVADATEVMEEKGDAMEPAQAQVPGEAMSRMSKLEGENVALKARLDERDARDERLADVGAALKRLEDRPLGADLEQKLTSYHETHGAAAFRDYVDSMVQTFGALSHSDTAAVAFAAQTSSTPGIALNYTEQGTEAVERAAQFAREHGELMKHGATRMSEERYVAVNMSRAGFAADA
jgi:hypothetical protein